METKQSSPSVSDSALRLPGALPDLPDDVTVRFPSLGTWQNELQRTWKSSVQAQKDFASAILDVTVVGGILYIDPQAASLYIRSTRGPGAWNDPLTPFFVNAAGFFSLGNSVSWNPTTKEAIFDGTIIAVAGIIGGWTIGATTLTGGGITLDSSGVITVGTGNDVVVLSAADATYRMWVGNATPATAPFSVTKAGAIKATSGTVGGWTLSATTISANNAVLDSAGQLLLGTGNDVVILSAVNATYRIWVGNATAGSAAFSVTKSGALFATGATISGNITATSGSIGGFNIGADYIRDVGNSMGLASTVTGGDDTRFWAGDTFANRATAPFRVNESGALFASNATISGDITATSGTIGGFTITATKLSAANMEMDSSGSFRVGPIGGQSAAMAPSEFQITNTGGVSVVVRFSNDGSNNGMGEFYAGVALTIELNGSTGVVTATGFAGDGSSLTALNASALGTGTVPTARLGSGAASSSTFLRGDQTWAAITVSAPLQLASGSAGAPTYSYSGDTDTGWYRNGADDIRAATAGADRFVVRTGAIVCLVPLKIDNTRVGGSPTPGGTVTIQDSSGSTISLITT